MIFPVALAFPSSLPSLHAAACGFFDTHTRTKRGKVCRRSFVHKDSSRWPIRPPPLRVPLILIPTFRGNPQGTPSSFFVGNLHQGEVVQVLGEGPVETPHGWV